MNAWHRVMIVLICLVLLIPVSLVYAQDQAGETHTKLERQVLTMLSGIEHFPSAEDWKALSPEGNAVLMRLAADEKQWPIRRARALLALGYRPSEKVKVFLADVMKWKGHLASMLHRHALAALATGFGGEAFSIIAPRVKAADYFEQEAAVRALGVLATPEAVQLLEKTRESAPASPLAETIRAELEKLRKP